MDDARFGLSIRALRRRRGWRQRDLAAAAGVSQALISTIERGHFETLSVRTLSAVTRALDARLVVEIRWRAGDLDRLVDQDHARLGAATAHLLRSRGWLVAMEVTYAEFGERGAVDVLAFHAGTCCLLVIEIKTDLASGEQTLRKLDEKVRLGPAIARKRFGWIPTSTSRLLVIAETATNRRRLGAESAFFGAALPARNVAVNRWLREPAGPVSGALFLATISPRVGIQKPGGRSRVRCAVGHPGNARASTHDSLRQSRIDPGARRRRDVPR